MFFFGIFGLTEKEAGTHRAEGVECGYCRQIGTQTVTVYERYIHFFFIPLIPLGKKAIAECSHCRRLLREDEFDEGLRRFYERLS